MQELRDPHKLYENIKKSLVDEKQYYVLLDEIQYVDRFHEVMNSLLRIENVDVYVTGSNSKFLSSDILTEFRGRGDEIRVYPLSFSEYLSAYDGTEEDAWLEYMTYGGLPRILSMQTDEQKSKYLTDLGLRNARLGFRQIEETHLMENIIYNELK